MSRRHGLKHTLWMAGNIFGLVMGGLFTPAPAAAIGCGDTLGPGGSFVLDSDIGPCAAGGLTVDSAELDMAGFTVSCSGAGTGVSVIGTGAVVKNGIVTNCSDGFVIRGRRHTLKRNTATGNVEKGFDVQGRRNTLRRNTATGNGDEGFNTAGDRNKLRKNDASGNSHNGFDIQSSNNKLRKNTANGNGSHGIVISVDFTGNRILENTATGNNDEDLFDENGECASNTWELNSFGDSNPDCIQ